MYYVILVKPKLCREPEQHKSLDSSYAVMIVVPGVPLALSDLELREMQRAERGEAYQ